MYMIKGFPVSCLAGWRDKHDKTQQEVADAIGTTRPQVSDWERFKCLPSAKFNTRLVKLTKGEVSAKRLESDSKKIDPFSI